MEQLEQQVGINKGASLDYHPEIVETIKATLNNGEIVVNDAFSTLLSRKDELVELFGGKSYGIMLLIELSKIIGFKVPHTEFIDTNFHKKLGNFEDKNEGSKLLKEFDSLLSGGFENGKLDFLKEYLVNNQNILKSLLNNINIENINGKYSFILELFCEFNGYDFNSIEQNEIGIVFYRLDESGGEKLFCRETSLEYLIDELRVAVLEGLLIINRDPILEVESLINPNITEELGYYDDYYMGEVNLRLKSNKFLGLDNDIVLTEENEKYLKEVFGRFSGSQFISIRSSANVEDGGENNYPGIFYTGFCSTSDFEGFKGEVINVLKSAKGDDVKNYQSQRGLSEEVFMGLTIMDIPGDTNYDNLYDKPAPSDSYSYSLYAAGLGGESENYGKIYYPDGGGVISGGCLGDDTFVRVSGVKGMPTLITSNSDQGIVVDIALGTGAILAYENQPGGLNYYRQNSVAGVIDNGKIMYKIDIIPYNYCDFKGDIKQDMCYNELGDSEVGYGGCSYLPFSLEQYKKIENYYPFLKDAYGYELELEFVIHNGEIYIIQSRKATTNFIKPDNMIKPDESRINELLLGGDEITSSMGYINNDELEIIELDANSLEYYSSLHRKDQREIHIYDKIKNLERSSERGYFVAIDWLSDFPYMKVSDYPNLKGIIMKGLNGLGTHALMRIRELGIPVIFLENNSKFFLKDLSGNRKVYMEGSNGAMIYR